MTKMQDYSRFIAVSRYAKWLEEDNRRETWEETVARYVQEVVYPVIKDLPNFEPEALGTITKYIEDHHAMPSMRALMAAGKAMQRDNTTAYNCSYLPVDDIRSFDEALFILMCGTGVGFSVEYENVVKLPKVAYWLKRSKFQMWVYKTFYQPKIVVTDSKEGWAKGLRQLIEYLYKGDIPEWDLRLLRPAGAKLKTFGGRSSGPEPLNELFEFVVAKFVAAAGRQLTPREAHDIMCKIGEVVVVGGVRRSAMISLSDVDDIEMAHAKAGDWWNHEGQRALANNSVSYTEKPSAEVFLKEWHSLVASKSGERGVFNRQASHNQAAKYGRRKTVDSEGNPIKFGTNPCSEIILRPYQFCNLTEVVIRAEDTFDTIVSKVVMATLLGTIQSTYVDFPYLRDVWRINTAEERLLGVSLTGIMDNPLMTTANAGLAKTLDKLREIAVEVNALAAKELGIPASVAITCVKPSGTVSQLVDSSSGIHARHSPWYIRTVRGDRKDPLTQFMIDQGIPYEACVMKPEQTVVFSFPMKSPEGAVTRNDMSAIDQLEMWLIYQRHWCEHKPSVTISVRDEEWPEVGQFVWKNFDEMSGVSFLPHSDHSYQQAPYQDCTEAEYLEALDKMPKNLDWSKLSSYETEDTTKGSQTLACSSGSCEIVDV